MSGDSDRDEYKNQSSQHIAVNQYDRKDVMAAPIFDFVAGDTNSVVRVTVVNKQTRAVIDLTNATVLFIYTIDTGSTQSRTMTVLSPATAGVVEYQFVTGDLVAGAMIANIEVTFADATILSQLDSFTFQVRAKL